MSTNLSWFSTSHRCCLFTNVFQPDRLALVRTASVSGKLKRIQKSNRFECQKRAVKDSSAVKGVHDRCRALVSKEAIGAQVAILVAPVMANSLGFIRSYSNLNLKNV